MATRLHLFDAHCHLQDPKIARLVPHLIDTTANAGVRWFAVNGTCEMLSAHCNWPLYCQYFLFSWAHLALLKCNLQLGAFLAGDWKLVQQMSETHSSVIPCFGLHPWFVGERSSDWLVVLRRFFEAVPGAALGEIGLDRGSRGKTIDFASQVEVFKQQLELARQLKKPATIHCVSAFGNLQEILHREMGSFPAGIILHSYLGSAEMVHNLAKFGAYFSFSGFLTSMKPQKAKKMLQAVPTDRILLETDAPDALPRVNPASLVWIPGDPSVPEELQERMRGNLTLHTGASDKQACSIQDSGTKEGDGISLPKNALNHPANIYSVLKHVASLLEMSEKQLSEISFENSMRVFSYPGSKLC